MNTNISTGNAPATPVQGYDLKRALEKVDQDVAQVARANVERPALPPAPSLGGARDRLGPTMSDVMGEADQLIKRLLDLDHNTGSAVAALGGVDPSAMGRAVVANDPREPTPNGALRNMSHRLREMDAIIARLEVSNKGLHAYLS